ncbi:MAG: UDP-N-acetylglucosamine 1-carboxyvinyltransferase, partial [Coriobacteriia bacterium]
MPSIIVTGGRPLSGTVRVGGAKNSALKLMAAAVLVAGESVIHNVSEISDVDLMARVLEGLGVRVVREGHSVRIDASTVTSVETPY